MTSSTIALPRLSGRARLRDLAARVGPWALGATAAILTGAGSWSPSFWGDEAASVMSAQRPLASLATELSRIDAVHGLYYLFLHGWIRVFGFSEFAVRFPSILAAGLAVTATVLVGREFFGLRIGMVAGTVLMVLPGFTVLAIDARSYAITIAVGAGLILLLARMIGPRPAARWKWAAYVAAFLGAIWLWAFAAMMIPVHAGLLLSRRADRTVWRRWILAMVLVVGGAVPIAVVTFSQRHQVAFLAHRDYLTWQHVLVQQWFGSPVVAILCWALIVVAVVAAARNPVIRRRVLGVATWAGLPTLLLIVASVIVAPIYNSRYTALSLPAVALLVAVGAAAVTRRLGSHRLIAAGVAVAIALTLVGGAAPRYLAQRGPFGFGADYRQVSEVIAANADAGDAMVFDSAVKPSWRPRVAMHLYPSAFTGVIDVGLATPFTERAGIWDSARPVSEIRLSAYPVVWAVEVRGSDSTDLRELAQAGYTVTATYSVHRTEIYRLERNIP